MNCNTTSVADVFYLGKENETNEFLHHGKLFQIGFSWNGWNVRVYLPVNPLCLHVILSYSIEPFVLSPLFG